jgi:hypothetical protein
MLREESIIAGFRMLVPTETKLGSCEIVALLGAGEMDRAQIIAGERCLTNP